MYLEKNDTVMCMKNLTFHSHLMTFLYRLNLIVKVEIAANQTDGWTDGPTDRHIDRTNCIHNVEN